MAEPVITTTAALIGAGAWFANKLFGPSVDALGEQFKIFSSERLTKIFKRAEEIADGEVKEPLSPGFSIYLIQKASFSEDSELITEMWANLLISATQGYSNRHQNFVDILSQIGGQEAETINELVPDDWLRYPATPPVNLKAVLRERLRKQYTAAYIDNPASQIELVELAQNRHAALLSESLGWPGFIATAEYPYYSGQNGDDKFSGVLTGGRSLSSKYDILIRQRLLETFSFDLNQSFSSPYVEGVLVTALGTEFVASCRGRNA